ncbi:transposable element Tcb1 transposase [Trichonephila clavipes]|nr:transposable element Tcb1 transposase [Trichonephila clavipes]
MTAQRYVHDILQPHGLPLMQRLPGAIFQQDNSWPHTARMSQDFLGPITTLSWPARSPDFSPIDYIWDHLGRHVGHLTSLNELEARLQQIWNEISQDIIQNLYTSIPDRIASCIRARGDSIGIVVSDVGCGAAVVGLESRDNPFLLCDCASRLLLYGDRFNSCQVIYSQFGLAIHQNDHQARRRFVEWAQNEIAVVSDFHKRILFSDEAHFWLNGYVNKQNCRIPQVYVETPLHPEKLTVWCALWVGGIIGPYFFKNDGGHNELWFQQDGATCHTARATIDLLKDTFGDRIISRFGPVNWLPRSCDLTPLDYFLWGYGKSLVYADKPQTLDHLEDNIRRVIADIRPQMLEKVIENWTSRLEYIGASHGSSMPEIIFKM